MLFESDGGNRTVAGAPEPLATDHGIRSSHITVCSSTLSEFCQGNIRNWVMPFVQLTAKVMGMPNYRVQVSDGPHAGLKSLPTLESAMAYRDCCDRVFALF